MEWFREELRILGLLKGRVEDLGWLRGELRIWIVKGRVEDLVLLTGELRIWNG